MIFCTCIRCFSSFEDMLLPTVICFDFFQHFRAQRRSGNIVACFLLVMLTVLSVLRTGSFSRTMSLSGKSSTSERPTTKVFYLKMFRAASSTIQNVFFRYGDVHNLTFVLPRDGWMIGYPRPFESSMVLPLPSVFSHQYDMFVNHARWNERSVNKILISNVISITSIRNPVTMFPSLYDYFSLQTSRYNVPLKKFLENPSFFTRRKKPNMFVKNPMATEFAIPSHICENSTLFDKELLRLNETFSLVMLVERLEESIVLMRKLLGWSWNDVVFFRTNERCDCAPKTVANDELARAIRKWNAADFVLYRFFEREFERKKRVYGLAKLKNDVNFLRKLNLQWYAYCALGPDIAPRCRCRMNDTSTDNKSEALVYSRSVRKDDVTCQRLGTHEAEYTKNLREKLWPSEVKAETPRT